MKPVKIAQIGTGHDHALPTFQSLVKNRDVFEVVGIAESNPQRAGELEANPLYRSAPHYTVEQLLEMELTNADGTTQRVVLSVHSGKGASS